MTPEETLQWLAICVAAAGRRTPLTEDDIRQHRQLVAAEMYRAEARRLEPKPQQQLNLAA